MPHITAPQRNTPIDPIDASGAVWLSTANDPARRLQAVYNLLTNRLSLLADDGVTLLGNFAPGSSNVISNSHGSLNCAGTGISISGNRLTVLWSVSATPALTGANTVSLRARDRGGLDTGFQLIPGSLVQAMADKAGGPFVAETLATFTMEGRQAGNAVESQEFSYAVTVGTGISVVNHGACPLQGEVRTGSPCNPTQDGIVDCCTEGNALLCPGTKAQ